MKCQDWHKLSAVMCFFLISLLTATIYNPLRQKRRRLGLLSKITTRRSFFLEKKI